MISAIIGLNEIIILSLVLGITVLGLVLYRLFKNYTKTRATRTFPGYGGTNAPDVLTQLERLGKLKDQGIINDEEFEQQKKKILG
jgi:hypothetical protein